jgi:site-specific DNA recombinase
MRVLAALRESRTDEHGTSLAGQRDQITKWADANGHTIIHVTVDASTSGSTTPFQRPNLGPWLTQPDLLSQWDILATSKLDRVSRSTVDFGNLHQWLQKHGKSYASVTEGIDLSTPIGKVIGGVLMVFAEFELDTIKSRCRERSARHAVNGTWNGGVLPFGWAAVEDGRAFKLVPDESRTAPIVRDMAGRFISGESTTRICDWLNGEGVKTARGAVWTPNAVRKVLYNDTTADLLDDSAQAALRVQLDGIKRPVSEQNGNAYLLTTVARCAVCEGPMYVSWKANRGYGYIRCPKRHVQHRMDMVDAVVDQFMMGESRPLTERVFIPGDDHSQQIRELEAKLELLKSVPEVDPAPVADKLAVLKAQPHDPGTWQDRPVTPEVTVAEHWQGLGTAARNELLRKWETVVTVSRTGYVIESQIDPFADTVELPL